MRREEKIVRGEEKSREETRGEERKGGEEEM